MNVKTIGGVALASAAVFMMLFSGSSSSRPQAKIKYVPIEETGAPPTQGNSQGATAPNTLDTNGDGVPDAPDANGDGVPDPTNPRGGVDPLIGADTPASEYGNLLAQGAYDSIGISTAGIPGTDNGNLGCAAAVSIMFQNTTGQQLVPGYDVVLGTGQLHSSLSNDPRFVAVSLNNAQPGDIVVTPRASQAGHTGIVGNNGEIISNSSSGFQGSAPGSIQNNYTVSQWQSSITPRNPNQTMAYRYVGG